MRVLVAPQEFKGTLTAAEAAQAIAAGVRLALPEADVDLLPMADGGPGTVRAMVGASNGGRILEATVHDPLGRHVGAEWGLLEDGSGVIEMASAAGLWRLREDERDPRVASTFGVGELIAEALAAGCRRIIVGLGGSATNDGGAGMAAALGVRLLDANGRELPAGGAALAALHRIEIAGLDSRLKGCEVVVACDVTSPLCGPQGASLLYGPQKGALPAVALELEAALRHYAGIVEEATGVSVLDLPCAGAAGGLGAGLAAFLGAKLCPGVEVVAEAVGLRERLIAAELLVTGEGRLDGQTSLGKTVVGVAAMARESGVPVLVVAGSLGDGWEKALPFFFGVESAAGAGGGIAHRRAVSLASARAVRGWLRVQGLM